MLFQGITVHAASERARALPIRISTLALSAFVASAGLSVGCDDSAATAAQSRASLNEVIGTLNTAEQGYTPGGVDQEYLEFRREKRQEVADQLDAIVKSADPVAATEARVLLASVKVSQARDGVQQADAAFARVGKSSRALFDQLAEIERINSLIVARSGDAASVLNDLGQGDALIRENKDRAVAELSEVASQRESAILDAEKHNNAAAGHFTQATEFEKQAFVASSDTAKQDAYTNAYRSRLAGQAAQKQAQEAQILADSFGHEAETLKNEIALWDRMAQQVDGLADRVRTDGDAAARDVSTASSSKGVAVATMKDRHEEISTTYTKEVNERLESAVQLAQQAVDLIDRAQGSASREQRSALAFDRLEAQVALTQALTRQARYAQDFTGIVRAIADNPAVSGTAAAQAASSEATRLSDSAKQATERAQKSIAAGLEQSEQLVGETQTGRAAAALAQALQTYSTQLN